MTRLEHFEDGDSFVRRRSRKPTPHEFSERRRRLESSRKVKTTPKREVFMLRQEEQLKSAVSHAFDEGGITLEEALFVRKYALKHRITSVVVGGEKMAVIDFLSKSFNPERQ